MASFLKEDKDFALTAYAPAKTGPYESYLIGVMPYLAFRAFISLIIFAGGFFYTDAKNYDARFLVCVVVAALMALTALFVTIHHAAAFLAYYENLGERPQDKAEEDITRQEKEAARNYRNKLTVGTWLRDAPFLPRRSAD